MIQRLLDGDSGVGIWIHHPRHEVLRFIQSSSTTDLCACLTFLGDVVPVLKVELVLTQVVLFQQVVVVLPLEGRLSTEAERFGYVISGVNSYHT